MSYTQFWGRRRRLEPSQWSELGEVELRAVVDEGNKYRREYYCQYIETVFLRAEAREETRGSIAVGTVLM